MSLILVLILILTCVVCIYLYYLVRLLQQVIINLWKYPESQHLDRFNLPERKDYRKLTVDAMPIIEIVKKYDCNAHGKSMKPCLAKILLKGLFKKSYSSILNFTNQPR